MKNATKHAEELKSLFKRLMKEVKPPEREPMDPLHALVRGAMTFDVSETRSEDAMKAIDREFVDLNELRVATDLEIQELLGQKYPLIEKRVQMITQSLNNIFEREHTLSLDRLRTISKKDARQFLRELPDIDPFIESYVVLFAFDGGAVPLDQAMYETLQEEEVIEEGVSKEDAQKFLEHNIKAEDCFDFYFCLRRYAYESRKKKK